MRFLIGKFFFSILEIERHFQVTKGGNAIRFPQSSLGSWAQKCLGVAISIGNDFCHFDFLD